jgi:hypothetical protein
MAEHIRELVRRTSAPFRPAPSPVLPPAHTAVQPTLKWNPSSARRAFSSILWSLSKGVTTAGMMPLNLSSFSSYPPAYAGSAFAFSLQPGYFPPDAPSPLLAQLRARKLPRAFRPVKQYRNSFRAFEIYSPAAIAWADAGDEPCRRRGQAAKMSKAGVIRCNEEIFCTEY